MSLHMIISGGQTGVDLGALGWAKSNGYNTGGWMPKGFINETGPHPEFRKMYGMQEADSSAYPVRTELNVKTTDRTLIFGNATSPGCRLTIQYCRQHRKPCMVVPWPENFLISQCAEELLFAIYQHSMCILNVAGNRESKSPGISDAIKEFLDLSFTKRSTN